MLDRDRFGQLEPGPLAATSTATDRATSPLLYFFTAVAAGVTVFFITRWLSRR